MFEKEIEEYELIRQEYQQKIADRMGERQFAQMEQTNTSLLSSSKLPSFA